MYTGTCTPNKLRADAGKKRIELKKLHILFTDIVLTFKFSCLMAFRLDTEHLATEQVKFLLPSAVEMHVALKSEISKSYFIPKKFPKFKEKKNKTNYSSLKNTKYKTLPKHIANIPIFF